MEHWGGPEEPTTVPLNKELACQYLSHQRPLTGHLRRYFTLIFYPSHSDPREARQAEKGGGGKGEEQITPPSLLILSYASARERETSEGH